MTNNYQIKQNINFTLSIILLFIMNFLPLHSKAESYFDIIESQIIKLQPKLTEEVENQMQNINIAAAKKDALSTAQKTINQKEMQQTQHNHPNSTISNSCFTKDNSNKNDCISTNSTYITYHEEKNNDCQRIPAIDASISGFINFKKYRHNNDRHNNNCQNI